MKKGVVSTIDLVVASVVVLFILVSVVEVWSHGVNRIHDFDVERDMYFKLVEVSESLVKTPGVPLNWHLLDQRDSETVSSIGLALRDNYLSRGRVEAFMDMEYEEARRILGLGRFDFHLELVNASDGDVIYEAGVDGEGATLERLCILGDDVVLLKFTLMER